ncbi:MAG: hypothetical protein ACAI38_05220 [Myxococcota bacterium]|nr:hypothetical protein [Myxococcota bacterium]
MSNPLPRIAPTTTIGTASPFSREGFETAVSNVQAHGTITDYGPPIGELKELEQIVGSRDGTHQRYVMTLRGFHGSDGVFYPYEVGLMSQNWVMHDEDGRFHIDIWKHFMSMDGTRSRSSHDSLVEDRRGNVFGWGSTPHTAAEAEENLTAALPRWVRYTPPASLTPGDDVDATEETRRSRSRIAPSITPPATLAAPTSTGALPGR